MKNRSKHKRNWRRQAIKGFDAHSGRAAKRQIDRKHGGGSGRRAVTAFQARRFYFAGEAPHFRMTARTLALPGHHIRPVARPQQETHCKSAL